MSIRIIEDIVRESYWEEDDAGASDVRAFKIFGLSGDSDFRWQASVAVDSTSGHGLPRIGDPHPRILDCYVTRVRITGVNNSRTQAKALVVYSYNPQERAVLGVRINGITSFGETNFDRKGKLLVTQYRHGYDLNGDTPPDPTSDNAAWNKDVHRVPILLPDTTLEIVMREPGPTGIDWIFNYRRRLNEKPWQGGQPGEWLCTHIIARDLSMPDRVRQAQFFDRTKVTWEVLYGFRFRPDPRYAPTGDNTTELNLESWRPVLVFRDRATGEQPADVSPVKEGWPQHTAGNGWTVADLYRTADFDKLYLPEVWPKDLKRE